MLRSLFIIDSSVFFHFLDINLSFAIWRFSTFYCCFLWYGPNLYARKYWIGNNSFNKNSLKIRNITECEKKMIRVLYSRQDALKHRILFTLIIYALANPWNYTNFKNFLQILGFIVGFDNVYELFWKTGNTTLNITQFACMKHLYLL